VSTTKSPCSDGTWGGCGRAGGGGVRRAGVVPVAARGYRGSRAGWGAGREVRGDRGGGAALARILAEHARFQVIPEQSDTDDPAAAGEAAQWQSSPWLEREVRATDGLCRIPRLRDARRRIRARPQPSLRCCQEVRDPARPGDRTPDRRQADSARRSRRRCEGGNTTGASVFEAAGGRRHPRRRPGIPGRTRQGCAAGTRP
jgi:hypothetical protein